MSLFRKKEKTENREELMKKYRIKPPSDEEIERLSEGLPLKKRKSSRR